MKVQRAGHFIDSGKRAVLSLNLKQIGLHLNMNIPLKKVNLTLSRFVRMGSSSSNNTYSDTDANTKYYDSDNKKAEEEFIFIVDLKESKDIEIKKKKRNNKIEEDNIYKIDLNVEQEVQSELQNEMEHIEQDDIIEVEETKKTKTKRAKPGKKKDNSIRKIDDDDDDVDELFGSENKKNCKKNGKIIVS